jgi:hypothetical protein
MRKHSRAWGALVVAGTSIIVAIACTGGGSDATHRRGWCVKGRRGRGIVASTLRQSPRGWSTESSAGRGSTFGPCTRCWCRSTRSRNTVSAGSGSRVVATWCRGVVEVALVSAIGQATPGRGTVASTCGAPCRSARSRSEGIVARARIMRGAGSRVPGRSTVAQAAIGCTVSFSIWVRGTRSVVLPSRSTRAAQASPGRSYRSLLDE